MVDKPLPRKARVSALVTLPVILAAIAALAGPARAVFPGRNGLLLVRGSAASGCAPPTVGAASELPLCTPLGGGHSFHDESLFLADAANGSVRLLVEGKQQEDTDPANGKFSPDGQRVALGSQTLSGVYADPALDGLVLFSVDPAVSPMPLRVGGVAPSWSPDGRQLVYYGGPPDDPQSMFRLTLGDGAPKRINGGFPYAWSSRNLIAYSGEIVNTRGDERCGARRRRNWSICTMRPNGQRATLTPLSGFNADWSPNGYRLVFWSYSRRRHAMRLMIGCPNGKGIRPLTTFIDGNFDATAVWSPDGSKIAFDYQGDLREGVMGRADVYEIPSNARHPLGPASWQKVVSNALLSDWQPVPPAPPRRAASTRVCS